MSNTIREYEGIDYHGDLGNINGAKMSVTAFMAGKWGAGIQLTVSSSSHEYISLAENQIKDLIKILQKRLDRIKGYSATDSISPKTIYPKRVRK